MERVFNSQLLCYLLKHELITKHQRGFIKHKSVSTNLLECLDDWTLNLEGKYITDVIYFDFKQVYDTVCHSKLLAKLTSYGICGNALVWIEAFLCSHSQSVYISQSISTPKSVVNGVPQGSVLGPMQFLLFINDLVDIFNDIPMSLSLFADDLKLYTCYKGDASHDDLQTATDRLIDW